MMQLARARLAAVTAAALVFAAATADATTLLLPSADPNLTDAGFFAGGAVLNISASGTIGLLGTDGLTHPDGSLAAPVFDSSYHYANVGASGYPTVNGGDGVNHFAGGGANFDIVSGLFGPAGAQTTDTTDPHAIRLGAIVGTFDPMPSRADYFLIGFGTDETVPAGGDHLYLLVNDTFNPNNTGSYTVTLTSQTEIAEPSAALLSISALAAMRLLKRRRRRRFGALGR